MGEGIWSLRQEGIVWFVGTEARMMDVNTS